MLQQQQLNVSQMQMVVSKSWLDGMPLVELVMVFGRTHDKQHPYIEKWSAQESK